ncbi:hypothetical protein C0J52_04650 [Blattella germanica]|nr:hypothetical protein C0J52_04650 [Blattella germanica]
MGVLQRLEPLKERFLSRVVRQSDVVCCGSVPFKIDIITELFGECKEELDDLEMQDEALCVYECAGKKLEVVDNKGKIKVYAYIELCQRMAEGDKTLEEYVRGVCYENAEIAKQVPEGN